MTSDSDLLAWVAWVAAREATGELYGVELDAVEGDVWLSLFARGRRTPAGAPFSCSLLSVATAAPGARETFKRGQALASAALRQAREETAA